MTFFSNTRPGPCQDSFAEYPESAWIIIVADLLHCVPIFYLEGAPGCRVSRLRQGSLQRLKRLFNPIATDETLAGHVSDSLGGTPPNPVHTLLTLRRHAESWSPCGDSRGDPGPRIQRLSRRCAHFLPRPNQEDNKDHLVSGDSPRGPWVGPRSRNHAFVGLNIRSCGGDPTRSECPGYHYPSFVVGNRLRHVGGEGVPSSFPCAISVEGTVNEGAAPSVNNAHVGPSGVACPSGASSTGQGASGLYSRA